MQDGNRKRRAGWVIALIGVLGLMPATRGFGNLLPNGDFEADPDGRGVIVNNGHSIGSITQWRVFAVGGGQARATVTSAAASSGAKGLQYSYDVQGADSAVDKDDPTLRVPVPANRVYRLLVDARDGGPYGGTPAFRGGFQFHNAGGGYLGGRSYGYDPSGIYETVGITQAAPATAATLSVRFDMGGAGRSVHLDNARVVDVTNSDRMINGGFENSPSRLLNWRFFAVGGAAGSATLSTDAHTGSYAARLERTVMAGDSGLDTWGGDIDQAVLSGETIVMSFAAKWLSGNGRISWNISTFDSNHTFLGVAAQGGVSPGASYGVFTSGPVTLNPNVAYVSVGFRVWDAPSVFLIDDVTLVPEPATAAGLLVAVGLLSLRRRPAA